MLPRVRRIALKLANWWRSTSRWERGVVPPGAVPARECDQTDEADDPPLERGLSWCLLCRSRSMHSPSESDVRVSRSPSMRRRSKLALLFALGFATAAAVGEALPAGARNEVYLWQRQGSLDSGWKLTK